MIWLCSGSIGGEVVCRWLTVRIFGLQFEIPLKR